MSAADYICILHFLQHKIEDTDDNNSISSDISDNHYFDSNMDDDDDEPTPSYDQCNLLAYATKTLPPGDLRHVLFSKYGGGKKHLHKLRDFGLKNFMLEFR